MKEHTLTQGRILKSLISFAFPVLVALFLQAMYGAVDLQVVGKFGTAADISAVSTGRAHIAMAGISINPTRDETVDFSENVFDSTQMIIVRSDNTDIQDAFDLEGKVVGGQNGTVGLQRIGIVRNAGINELNEIPGFESDTREFEPGEGVAIVERLQRGDPGNGKPIVGRGDSVIRTGRKNRAYPSNDQQEFHATNRETCF